MRGGRAAVSRRRRCTAPARGWLRSGRGVRWAGGLPGSESQTINWPPESFIGCRGVGTRLKPPGAERRDALSTNPTASQAAAAAEAVVRLYWACQTKNKTSSGFS